MQDGPQTQMTTTSFPCHKQVIFHKLPPAGMHLLVIEDEPRILAFLARALEAEGFVVDGADNGLDGLSRAIGGSYDLVILDLLLPRVD